MGKITIGSKPSNNPAGYGGFLGDTGYLRGTTFAGRAKPYWIVRLGGRVGKWTSSTATVRYGAYLANVSTWQPAALAVQTGTVSVTVLGNSTTGNAGGANYELPVTAPVLIAASQPVTLAVLGTGASWWHGQDNSGATMHERSGLSSLPNPFGGSPRPEGTMSLWAVAFENTNPTIPTNTLEPTPGTTTIDPTPTIAFDFRDAEEVLEGFALGQGDYLKKYQVQLYSGATKVYDSGVVTASSPERTARRVSVTIPDDIDPGLYKARVQVWDAADAPSGWKEWTFTRVGAGSLVLTSPSGRTNDTTPDIAWSYSHAEDLAMDRMIVRITTTAGAVVRSDFDYDFTVDPTDPSTGTLAYADTGWADLPAGNDYLVQARAVDTDSQPSPWSNALAFHVNAAPLEPAALQPAAGHVTTTPPQLSALITDGDDVSSTLAVTFRIRDKSVGGAGTDYTGLYNAASGRHYIESGTALVAGGYDDYEWQVQATDPGGLTSPATAWRTLTYVAPPEITIVAPTGTATTSAPAFDWDIDRAQTSFRLRLYDDTTGQSLPNADSGWITRSDTEHTLPYLLLRNDTTVRGLLEVMTTGDIPGSIEWTFDVAYTPPDEVTNFTATPVMEDFDYPDSPSAVLLTWDAAETDESDFDAYIIRARTVGADEWEEPPLALLTSVATTQFVVDTAPSGVAREYSVVQRVWNQLDLIESLPVTDQATVHLVATVLSVVIGGQGRAVLPRWSSRGLTPVRDRVVRKNWSRYPRIAAGPGNYREITGTFQLHPPPGSSWSAADLAAAVHDLADVWIDEDGNVRDKVLCYRDPRGRVAYVSMLRDGEQDEPVIWGEMDIELVEVAYPGGAS